jgi:hypothetical protein
MGRKTTNDKPDAVWAVRGSENATVSQLDGPWPVDFPIGVATTDVVFLGSQPEDSIANGFIPDTGGELEFRMNGRVTPSVGAQGQQTWQSAPRRTLSASTPSPCRSPARSWTSATASPV